MYIDALSRVLNYLEVIEHERPSSLLGITLQTERELLSEGHDGWLNELLMLKKGLQKEQGRGNMVVGANTWKMTMISIGINTFGRTRREQKR